MDNIIEEIERIARKDIAIDYDIVDQIEEGNYPELTDRIKTFTVTIMEKSSNSGVLLEAQSFDELNEGLEWAIIFAKREFLGEKNEN